MYIDTWTVVVEIGVRQRVSRSGLFTCVGDRMPYVVDDRRSGRARLSSLRVGILNFSDDKREFYRMSFRDPRASRSNLAINRR